MLSDWMLNCCRSGLGTRPRGATLCQHAAHLRPPPTPAKTLWRVWLPIRYPRLHVQSEVSQLCHPIPSSSGLGPGLAAEECTLLHDCDCFPSPTAAVQSPSASSCAPRRNQASHCRLPMHDWWASGRGLQVQLTAVPQAWVKLLCCLCR